MNKQSTPETMKKEQIIQIIDTVLKEANIVCTDEDQIRAYTQGARQITFAIYMALFDSGTLNREDMNLFYNKLNEEVIECFS